MTSLVSGGCVERRAWIRSSGRAGLHTDEVPCFAMASKGAVQSAGKRGNSGEEIKVIN